MFAAMVTMPERQSIIAIIPCHSGNIQEGERLLEPLRRFGPPVADTIRPMSYFEMVSLLDPGFPAGRNYYDKGCFLAGFSDAAMEVTIEAAKSRISPFSAVVIQQSHGAAARVPVEATAALPFTGSSGFCQQV